MSFIQNLGRDLVDKKLWPVAGGLVVAAVAVPVAIGGGSSSSDEPVPPVPVVAAPQDGVADGTQVTLAAPDTTKAHVRPGKARDPFAAILTEKAPKPASVAGASSPAGVAAAPKASSSTAKSGGTSTGSTAAPSPTPSPTPTPSTSTTTSTTYFQYAVTLQTKRDGKLTTREAVRPITYVPSPAYPLLAFLGVKNDHKTVTFLVRDDVEISGADRVCRPSRTNCQFLELQPGDDVLINKIPPAGVKAHHFRLIVGDIAPVPIKKPTKAEATARARTRAFRDVPPVTVSPDAAATTTRATTRG